MKSTIEIHGVGFSTDLDRFHRSPLPEVSCCRMNSCFFPVDVVVDGVGVYGYPVLLIPLLHCLLVFTCSDLTFDLHGPVHPVPFSPPFQNADKSDTRYA